jgi:DNA-binding NarL/FixJ family response regulator
MVTVLVADDQDLVRAGIAALIRAAPGLDVVAEARDGSEAVRLAARVQPDVVLMDIRMPGINGLDATEAILAAAHARQRPRPIPRILVLTTFDLDEYVFRALRAGASGFLLKETRPERLLAAVRTVAEGETLLAPSVTRRLIENYVSRPGAAQAAPRSLQRLTPREMEVLKLVATGADNTRIAGELVLSESTVKTHLNRAMAKLGLSSRAQAVVVAYESGLVKPGYLPPAQGSAGT